jgi:AraC-like DNA-binding protein
MKQIPMKILQMNVSDCRSDFRNMEDWNIVKNSTPKNSFLPLQPEFEMKTAYYNELHERDVQTKSSLLFYQFKMNENFSDSISVIPDGCIDILFCCDQQKPSANVCGSVLQSKSINLEANHEYFGVRFLPNQDTKKMKFSLKDMINQEVPLVDMISLNENIVEEIIDKQDFFEKITLFKQMVKSSIFTDDTSPSIINYALNRIYDQKGNISISQLADETGYSSRYIRKKFEDNIGISPKLFSQIVRFQYSLFMLIKNNKYSISDIINENGYYDQAHLINEFKKFGYMSPNKLSKSLFVNL